MEETRLITCQVGFYPMSTGAGSARVEDALAIIRSYPLETQVGPMSTTVSGESGVVHAMLADLTNRMQSTGHEFVMTITISNVCPWP